MERYQLTLLSKNEDDKEAVKELIGKIGGEVTDERALGQKPLAYPIKKERVAHFTLLHFLLDPERVLELNRELLLSGHVLRHMITTAKAKTPVAFLEQKGMGPTEEELVKPVREGGEPKEKEPARPAKEGKKTQAQTKAEAQAAKDRQKRIEEELEKILREE